jgi:hypothetical protein
MRRAIILSALLSLSHLVMSVAACASNGGRVHLVGTLGPPIDRESSAEKSDASSDGVHETSSTSDVHGPSSRGLSLYGRYWR